MLICATARTVHSFRFPSGDSEAQFLGVVDEEAVERREHVPHAQKPAVQEVGLGEVAVARVGHHPVGSGAIGPVAAELRFLYLEAHPRAHGNLPLLANANLRTSPR